MILKLFFLLSFAFAETQITPSDAPWATLATTLMKTPNSAKEKVLKKENKKLAAELQKLKSEKDLKNLWGKSKNFDDNAKATIVDESILEMLLKLSNTSAYSKPTAHAGIIHTFGYLFSILDTPYGFKRSRWVSGEINQGFGFEAISPSPKKGNFFSNITYFAGRIAFYDEKTNLKVLEKNKKNVDPVLIHFPYTSLKIHRLTEIFLKPRKIILRTDIVEFPNLSQDANSNTALLIYSIFDSQDKHSKLITLFPVKKSFGEALFSEKELGQNKEIKLKYNLFIDGIEPSSNSGTKESKEIKIP